MTTKDNSELAFAAIGAAPSGDVYHQTGMSLRDWFAGQALAGMLAHGTRYRPREGASNNWHEAISEEAYQLSDAMIAERSK